MSYKEIDGVVTSLPRAFSTTGTPLAVLGENINNQGCFRDDGLDMYVFFSLKNVSSEKIILLKKNTSFKLDGKIYAIQQHFYYIGDEKNLVPFKEYMIRPGESVNIKLSTRSFTPSKVLKEVNEIEASLLWGSKTIVIKFEDVKKVPIQQGRWHHKIY